ncbi:unnamed protein product, partial [Callosobruchus maculatus]
FNKIIFWYKYELGRNSVSVPVTHATTEQDIKAAAAVAASASLASWQPSTIVAFIEDKINFPTKWVKVVMKQLFQYGVKGTYESEDKMFISPSYSPKGTTLKRKFGSLPVRYMRVKIDKDDDFKILERVVRRYHFNLLDEQIEDLETTRLEGGTKRKFYLQPPTLLVDDDDAEAAATSNNDSVNNRHHHHQAKRSSTTTTRPSTSAAAAKPSTAATATAIMDDASDAGVVDLDNFDLN